VVPTHTFKTAPELEVLIVPGSIGTRGNASQAAQSKNLLPEVHTEYGMLISHHVAPSPLLNSIIAFVKERYPCLQHLITICRVTGIAARAGVLDGKYATTDKRAWGETIALGPKVNWVAVARWVVDGNIWISSGISAGIDLTIAFLEAIYGNETATTIANAMEYEGHTNSTDNPFAALYRLTDANNSTNPDVASTSPATEEKR
jgi:transcriptional regulator GlxA family with amidase domain